MGPGGWIALAVLAFVLVRAWGNWKPKRTVVPSESLPCDLEKLPVINDEKGEWIPIAVRPQNQGIELFGGEKALASNIHGMAEFLAQNEVPTKIAETPESNFGANALWVLRKDLKRVRELLEAFEPKMV